MSRVRKICPICAFWRDGYCSMRREIIPSDVHVARCEMFELKAMPKKTLFNRIMQSPERLAETYMFNHDGKVFKSLLLPNMVFNSREEAHAATVAKLKEEAE